MAKLIKPAEFGKFIAKLQGEMNESQFALHTGITRQTLRGLKSGLYLPTKRVLDRLGCEMLYRQAAPIKEATPTPVKATKPAAKKASKKAAKK